MGIFYDRSVHFLEKRNGRWQVWATQGDDDSVARD